MTRTLVDELIYNEAFLAAHCHDLTGRLVYELKMPKRTVLRADATFDSSLNNRFNPDSKAEVRNG